MYQLTQEQPLSVQARKFFTPPPVAFTEGLDRTLRRVDEGKGLLNLLAINLKTCAAGGMW